MKEQIDSIRSPLHILRCLGELVLIDIMNVAYEGDQGIMQAWEGDDD